MNPAIEAEMQRMAEDDFGRILNPTQPAIHYTRQFMLDLLMEIKREAFNEEAQTSPADGSPFHKRYPARFRALLIERADFIMEQSKLVYAFMDDPAQAIADLREPQRMKDQEARAARIVEDRTRELERMLDVEITSKKSSMMKALEAHAQATTQGICEGKA